MMPLVEEWGDCGSGRGPELPPAASFARLDDAALMRMVIARSFGAFSEIMARYVVRIKGVAQQYAGSYEDAQDVAQDVAMAVWRKAERCYSIEQDNPAAWILRLARNRAIDYWRSKAAYARNVAAFIEDFGTHERFHTDTALDPVTRAESMLTLMIEAGGIKINPGQRAVVSLVCIEGKSIEAAAALLRIPVGTVKSRLMVARGRLRRTRHLFFPGKMADLPAPPRKTTRQDARKRAESNQPRAEHSPKSPDFMSTEPEPTPPNPDQILEETITTAPLRLPKMAPDVPDEIAPEILRLNQVPEYVGRPQTLREAQDIAQLCLWRLLNGVLAQIITGKEGGRLPEEQILSRYLELELSPGGQVLWRWRGEQIVLFTPGGFQLNDAKTNVEWHHPEVSILKPENRIVHFGPKTS